MSISALNATDQITGLSVSDHAVLTFLARWSDKTGQIAASVARIAKATHQSIRSVQRASKRLRERGLLARRDRYKKISIYTVLPGQIAKIVERGAQMRTNLTNNKSPSKKRVFWGDTLAPKRIRTIDKEKNRGGCPVDNAPKRSKMAEPLTIEHLTAEKIAPDIAKRHLERCIQRGKKQTLGYLYALKKRVLEARATLEDVFLVMDERGWIGWRAEWGYRAAPAATPVSTPGERSLAWLTTASGIEAKGREHGLYWSGVTVQFQSFKRRVILAEQLTEGEKARARADYGIQAWQME